MRNVSKKVGREIQNTHFLFNNFFYRKSCCLRDVGTAQMAIQRMRIAWWIPKSTNTSSEYVILIDFLLQHWSHERPSMLRYNTLPVLLFVYHNMMSHIRTVLGFLHFFGSSRPTWKYHLRFLPSIPICILYKAVLTRIVTFSEDQSVHRNRSSHRGV